MENGNFEADHLYFMMALWRRIWNINIYLGFYQKKKKKKKSWWTLLRHTIWSDEDQTNFIK